MVRYTGHDRSGISQGYTSWQSAYPGLLGKLLAKGKPDPLCSIALVLCEMLSKHRNEYMQRTSTVTEYVNSNYWCSLFQQQSVSKYYHHGTVLIRVTC